MERKEARKALKVMSKAGYVLAEFEFNGSGDDGSINLTKLQLKGNELVEVDRNNLTSTVNIASETLADFLSNAIPFDWINNDGGSGTIQLNLLTGDYQSITAHYNTTEESHAEFYSEVDNDNGSRFPSDD